MDSFISERFKALAALFPGTTQIGNSRDPHGTYAFTIQSPTGRQYYFAAKNSMKGGIISIHKSLLADAFRFRRMIIVAVKEDFYRFDAREIYDRKSFENVFHGAVMVNFSIALGHNLLKADERSKREPDPTLFEQTPGMSDLARAVVEQFGGERMDQITSGGMAYGARS